MPLMEVVLEQQFANQQCINRWNYVASGTPAAVTYSFALLEAMGWISVTTALIAGTIGAKLQSIQNAGAHFVQATARAVYVDEDFFGNPFVASTNGAVATGATALSPLSAYGFRSNRVRQSIGRGYKRFTGMDEGAIEAGGLLTSAAQTDLQGMSDLMGDTLTYDDSGNTLTFVPCIVQKEKYTTPSGKTAYRYYSTESLQAAHLASGILWEAYDQMRSQVSRQYGRGS